MLQKCNIPCNIQGFYSSFPYTNHGSLEAERVTIQIRVVLISNNFTYVKLLLIFAYPKQ